MDEDLIEEAEEIIKSVDFPSHPQILLNIYNEVLKPEADFRKIKEYVSQDIAMSAKVIKVANSAFFGLRYKVHSIEHALTVLGLENFTNIIAASSLRNALMGSRISANVFEDFFDHSMNVARIAQFITHKVRIFSGGIIFPSQTYMAGLFHDCGIIILSKKYPDYFEIIKSSFVEKESLIDIEENLYQTNHCIVGYVVAKSWQLPDVVCQIIQHHHDRDFNFQEELSINKLLSINILAEGIIYYLTRSEDSYKRKIYDVKIDSKEFIKKILFELNFDNDDFKDILDTAKDIVG